MHRLPREAPLEPGLDSWHNAVMIRSMASKSRAKASLESSLEEAKKFGASAGEARRIHRIVAENASVPVIRSFELKFGPDSTNNRAVWVHLIVDDDLKPSKDKISEVHAIANRVRSALLRENLNFWPYVDVRGR